MPAKTIGKGARTRGSVTDGQDVELPMSFEVRAGDEGQCRGDGVESFTGSTWGMASGTPVLLRPGVCLVMGSAIASDHTGKIGVCCFGLASQAWVLRASFVDSDFIHAPGLEGEGFFGSCGGRLGGGGDYSRWWRGVARWGGGGKSS